MSQAVPLKETRSQVWILPGHLTPAQRSVLTSLSPKGVGVLKGQALADRKGRMGMRSSGCGQSQKERLTIRRRGPDSLVSTAPTASVQTSTPGAHFTVFIFCGEHPSSAFCTQL